MYYIVKSSVSNIQATIKTIEENRNNARTVGSEKEQTVADRERVTSPQIQVNKEIDNDTTQLKTTNSILPHDLNINYYLTIHRNSAIVQKYLVNNDLLGGQKVAVKFQSIVDYIELNQVVPLYMQEFKTKYPDVCGCLFIHADVQRKHKKTMASTSVVKLEKPLIVVE